MSFTLSPELLGLEDQVAIVDGGALGIGRAVAVKLAQAGAHVAIVDINDDEAAKTAALVEELGRRSIAIHADLTNRADVERAQQKVIDELGVFSVIVNVTGGVAGALKPFLDYTIDDWESAQRLNEHTTLLATQVAAVNFIKNKVKGKIVNVGSTSGVTGAPNISSYGAANAGVIHFTKSASMELAPYGIRVNCLVPGTHWTDQMRAAFDSPDTPDAMRDYIAKANAASPMGRLGEPEETAGVAVFLASNLSGYMTGHAVVSDGGVTNTTARPAVGGAQVPEAIKDYV